MRSIVPKSLDDQVVCFKQTKDSIYYISIIYISIYLYIYQIF